MVADGLGDAGAGRMPGESHASTPAVPTTVRATRRRRRRGHVIGVPRRAEHPYQVWRGTSWNRTETTYRAGKVLPLNRIALGPENDTSGLRQDMGPGDLWSCDNGPSWIHYRIFCAKTCT